MENEPYSVWHLREKNLGMGIQTHTHTHKTNHIQITIKPEESRGYIHTQKNRIEWKKEEKGRGKVNRETPESGMNSSGGQ